MADRPWTDAEQRAVAEELSRQEANDDDRSVAAYILDAVAPLIAARVREQVAAATLRWTATYHGGTALHVLAEQVADGDPRTADLMRYVQRATTEGADHA